MLDPSKAPQTLAELAQRAFVSFQSRPCLGVKDRESKEYKYLTYGQVGLRARYVAGGLLDLGLERGDRAAIISENRPEWAIADFACQLSGVISVPLFSTLPSAQIEGILRDCGARLVFVSDKSQRAKIEEIRDRLPELQHVVVMDEADTVESTLSYASLEKNGQEYFEARIGAFESMWPAAAPDDVATIIYTSGTTGEPKGVMLCHRNIGSNIEGICKLLTDAYGQNGQMPEGEIFLSFLPLAHIFERTAGFWVPMRLGAAIAYTESLRTVDRNLQEVRPTFMFCVPRLYESMREKLLGAASSLPEGKQEKYLDALQLAKKAGAARGGILVGGKPSPGLGLGESLKYKLYDMAVYSKVREKFGGRLRAFVSGGAPMSADIGALFTGLGVTILEGYGLTETSPVIAVNRPGHVKLGTVGEILPGVEVKIADDGEILARGPSIMKGYWNKPKETADAVNSEGWFHTGDIGVLENNYLKITDRKKDLLVLANGKKVAPAPIEMHLAQSKYISQVVLLGDKQKAVSALIVPQMEVLRVFAAKQNLGIEEDCELVKAPAVLKLMRDEIDSLSRDLADFEKVRKFSLVSEAFTVEGGELTPTLKVKRRVVAEKHAALVGTVED
ncbi:MAG: long-chain acyl-CoA synthetase [Abditibacteriota bacterium]|nr:long-chain acyl-CoA synthetase [Abditibacteriota bacterium]